MFALFSIFLLTSTAIGDEEVKYTDVKAGETVPFDGKLFTNESIAKILADHNLELETKNIEKEIEIEKINADNELMYSILEKKYDLETKMYKDMIENRDVILKESNVISKPISKWEFIGGFLAGAAVTIGIAYSLDHLSN